MPPMPTHPDRDATMIPQPAAPSADLAVASAVVAAVGGDGGGGAGGGGGGNAASMLGIGLAAVAPGGGGRAGAAVAGGATAATTSKGLVFAGSAVDEDGDEMSMEELRMRIPRYWTSVVRGH